MIKEFAKIYNTKEYGQLLITNDTRDGLPSVNIQFQVSDDFGICEKSFKFKDGHYDKADKAFEQMTEELAIKVVSEIIEKFKGL